MRILYNAHPMAYTSLMFCTPERAYYTSVSIETIVRMRTFTEYDFREFYGNTYYWNRYTEIKNLKKFLLRARIIL